MDITINRVLLMSTTTFRLDNLDTNSLNNVSSLLRHCGLTPANHAKSEAILDQFFLHIEGLEKDAQVMWSNSQKIKLLGILLRRDIISTDYYKTQAWRYQIKTLQDWCKHSIFSKFKSEGLKNKIYQLPLPKPLQQNLVEFAEHQANVAHLELRSP